MTGNIYLALARTRTRTTPLESDHKIKASMMEFNGSRTFLYKSP